jgi:hypothetical protein
LGHSGVIFFLNFIIYQFLLDGFIKIRDGFSDPNPGPIYILITAIADAKVQSQQQASVPPLYFTPLNLSPSKP